ncbi:glycosyltransferase family 39 protein [Candidatus Saccharibacteria bacterium]|nr:glycosyltransferase family 39 protein [Candidatus Saccharibacteria bacterium]
MNQKRRHILCMFIPLVFSVVYMLFCIINIRGSIWFDESFSAYLIRGNFADIWNLTAQDVHPPLFYFLLKIWSLIFGNTDFALRFMSVFFGAVAIILAFHLLKRWFGAKIATASSFMLALSPMFIRFGAEMRMYTLVFTIVIGATYALDVALEKREAKYWALYAILIALGMWTHYFAAIAWLAHLIYLVFIRKEKIWKKPLLPTYIFAIILYLPWVPFFLKQTGTVQGNGFWIPELTAVTPLDYLGNAVVYKDAEYITGWGVLLLAGVVIFTTVALVKAYKNLKKAQKDHFRMLLLLVFAPPLILILLSLPPLRPMFIDRYVIYAASLVWALFGLAIFFNFRAFKERLAKKRRKRELVKARNLLVCPFLLLGLVITSAVVGIVNVEAREPRGYVKDIYELTSEMADENEPILMNNVWNYYDAIFYSSAKHPVYIMNDWISYEYGSEEPVRKYHYNVIDDLDGFKTGHDRFWYITDLPNAGDDSVSSKLTGDSDAEAKSPIDGYRVVSEISNGHHLALELEKE